MRTPLTLLLLLLLQISSILCSPYSLPCKHTDQCLCYAGSNELEYQCPPDMFAEWDKKGSGVLIHLNENFLSVQLDCLNIETFDVESLIPAINASATRKARVRYCPQPSKGLKSLLDRFGVEQLSSLIVSDFKLKDSVIGKEFLEGIGELKDLSLSSLGLTRIEEDAFVGLPYLRTLELDGNQIRRLESKVFDHTKELRFLDLYFNQLEEIPAGLFKSLKELKVLRLWKNELRALEEFSFEGLEQLARLTLDLNQLSNVSEEAFAPLRNLVDISMQHNKLTKLPARLFQQNPLLKSIGLDGNSDLQLQPGLFSNLTNLKEVRLRRCNIIALPADMFSGSWALERIHLERNSIAQIPRLLFKNLSELRELDLGFNMIEHLADALSSLNSLEVLNLEGNQLRKVDGAVFKGLAKLRVLNLGRNRIHAIDDAAFVSNVALETVQLHHNSYAFKQSTRYAATPFDNMLNLEHLDLSHNLVREVPDDMLINKVYLKTLNLNNNFIKDLLFVSLQTVSTNKVAIDLSHNNITSVDFRMASIVVDANYPLDDNEGNDRRKRMESDADVFLEGNPLTCDCHLFDLVRYLRNDLNPRLKDMANIRPNRLTCAGPAHLAGTPLKDLRLRELECPLDQLVKDFKGCPVKCSCIWRPLDGGVVVDCSNRNLSAVPEVVVPALGRRKVFHVEVNLEGNGLKEAPKEGMGYEDVTRLHLSKNRIEEIVWVPPKIETLAIDHNSIRRLESKVLNALDSKKLKVLSLDNNPWNCDCDTRNLTNFVRHHPHQVEASAAVCANNGRLLVDFCADDDC